MEDCLEQLIEKLPDGENRRTGLMSGNEVDEVGHSEWNGWNEGRCRMNSSPPISQVLPVYVYCDIP